MTIPVHRHGLKHGTAAEWTAANPILALGEEGYETDTGKRKVGDGTTAWTSLAYSGGGSTAPDATTSSKGSVQLAGDLGGTAASPTVPGLTSKVPTSRQVAGHALTGDVTLGKADVGLPNVDNTADASKPVSTAQAAADATVLASAEAYTDAETTRAQAAEAAITAGLKFKAAVVVNTANVASRSGLPTTDGVTLTDGQIILLVAQTSGSQNGLWAVHSGAWTRPSNYAAGADATATSVFVEAGTANASSTWVVTGTTNNVVDTNVVTFQQASGLGEVTAGTALSKSGNTLNVQLGATGTTAAAGNDSRITGAVQTGSNPATGVSVSTSGLVVVTHTNVQSALADLDAAVAAGPTGTAGGDLTGTYPSPTVANSAITNAKVAAGAAIDPTKIALVNDGAFTSPTQRTAAYMTGKRRRGGRYYTPRGVINSYTDTFTPVAGTLYFARFHVERPMTFDQLPIFWIGGATSGQVRAGVYADDGQGEPTGAAVMDSGLKTAGTAANTSQTMSFTAVAIATPGLYHLALLACSNLVGGTLLAYRPELELLGISSIPTGAGSGPNNGMTQTGLTTSLPTIGTLTYGNADKWPLLIAHVSAYT